jgi:PAS domain S-box-containing protein
MNTGEGTPDAAAERNCACEDHEERVRSLERELREAELERRQLAALVDHAAAGFLVVDRAHRVIWNNSVFLERFLSDPDKADKIRGSACNRLLCGKPKICDGCPVGRCFESGEAEHHELRLWIRDRYHSVYVIAIPIRADSGDVEQAMIMLIDVSDLESMRRSDEAFLASEQRFRMIFDRSTVGMATLRPDGTFVQVNRALCSMLGYTESDLQRKRLLHVIHPEDRRLQPERTHDAASGALRTEEVERRYVRRDGTEVWGQTTTVKQLDEIDRPVHTTVMIQDITERKRAKQEMEQARTDYAALIDTIDGVVWEADPETLQFTYVSKRAESILGFPPDKWLSQPRFWRNRVHPDDLDRVSETFSSAAFVRGSFELDYRMVAADGRTVWVRNRVGLVEGPAGKIKMRGVMTDITEFRTAAAALEKSQEQLRQTQRMRAIGRLAGGLARDFDEQLATIASCSAELLKGADSDASLQAKARQIARAARCATELTGQLRAFSLRQALQPRVLDLSEAVADMEGMIRRVLGEETVLVTTPGSSRGTVKIDPGRLQQVVLSLAVNAQDAMPEGGRLSIFTEDIEIGAEQAEQRGDLLPGRYVKLVVGDTGCGMESTTHCSMSESLTTTKDSDDHPGQKLSAVQGIVEQSGGQLRVFNDPLHGTCFELCIPRVDFSPSDPSDVDSLPEYSPLEQTPEALSERETHLSELANEFLELNREAAHPASNEAVSVATDGVEDGPSR